MNFFFVGTMPLGTDSAHSTAYHNKEAMEWVRMVQAESALSSLNDPTNEE